MFRQGPLNQDRTHVLKLLATYMLGDHVSFGTSIRVQSGQPWAAMGRDWWGGIGASSSRPGHAAMTPGRTWIC